MQFQFQDKSLLFFFLVFYVILIYNLSFCHKKTGPDQARNFTQAPAKYAITFNCKMYPLKSTRICSCKIKIMTILSKKSHSSIVDLCSIDVNCLLVFKILEEFFFQKLNN